MSDRLSPEEIRVVRTVVETVADAIRDLRSVPSGHLFARLQQYLSLATYEAVISLLVDQKRVRRDPSHLLTWIGESK